MTLEMFASYDGTRLAYRVVGEGPPLICVPGGPGQAVEYFGELGGLSRSRTLILLDNRGTGHSASPADPGSYRVDRLTADIEALRMHLGLDTFDLLGHSASGGTCMLYASQHAGRLDHLVLVSPSLRVTGLQSDLDLDAVLQRRSHEPWYPEALHALNAEPTTLEELERYRFLATAFLFGQWSEAAQAYAREEPAQFAQPAKDGFYDGFVPDPALPGRLGELDLPVLLLGGELDIWPTAAGVRRLAELFNQVRLSILADSGHFAWIDSPGPFTGQVEEFLRV